jgi:tetratricopeptide (TPR) repeat protein
MFVLGSKTEALADFEKLIHDAPDYYEAYPIFAALLLKHGDRQRAFELVSKAIRCDPECAGAYYIRAQLFFNQKAFAQCVSDLDAFISKEPISSSISNSNDPYTLRGLALLNLGRVRRATLNFLFVLRVDPENYDAAKGLWQVYSSTKRYALAARMAQMMARSRPKSLDTYLACLESYAAVGNTRESQAAQENAMELASKNPNVHWKTGVAYVHTRRYKEALESFNKAISLDAHHVDALIAKAELLAACPDASLRDGRAALELLQTSLKKNEANRGEAMLVMAKAYAELKDYDQAIQSVRIAEKVFSTASPDHYLLETCSKAITALQKRNVDTGGK